MLASVPSTIIKYKVSRPESSLSVCSGGAVPNEDKNYLSNMRMASNKNPKRKTHFERTFGRWNEGKSRIGEGNLFDEKEAKIEKAPFPVRKEYEGGILRLTRTNIKIECIGISEREKRKGTVGWIERFVRSKQNLKLNLKVIKNGSDVMEFVAATEKASIIILEEDKRKRWKGWKKRFIRVINVRLNCVEEADGQIRPNKRI